MVAVLACAAELLPAAAARACALVLLLLAVAAQLLAYLLQAAHNLAINKFVAQVRQLRMDA